MSLFQKRASSAASLQADLATLRRRLADLETQRERLQQSISAHTEAVHKALMDEAAEAVVAKAEDALTSAERRLSAVVNTIAALGREIAEKEAEIAATARQKAAEEAVAAMRADDAKVCEMLLQLADIAATLLPVATRHSQQNWDAQEVAALARMMGEELPRLAARVSETTAFETERLLSGAATPRTVAPVAAAAPLPAPIPRKRVFAMARLQWREADQVLTCGRHAQVELPVALAAKAIELRYAIEMTDKRVHGLSSGAVPAPLPGPDNVDLDERGLQPFRPTMGTDAVLARAGMTVTEGGQQSSFVQRGQ